MGRVGIAFALLLAGCFLVAPVGGLVLESLRADLVVTTSGDRLVGHRKDSDARGVSIAIPGEEATRLVPRAEVAREGRVFTLQHYRSVLRGRGDRNMLLATLALASSATLLAFLLGLPLGILLGASNLPGRRWIEGIVVLPLVTPPIFSAIATYFDLAGFRPEFLRAVLVFGLCLFPLVALFTARALRLTGADAIDAARLCAPPGEVFLRVMLGPALPGAAAGALLCFCFVVSDFAVPDFLGVTTARNTILVYANAVFNSWKKDGNAGLATAAGMPPTILSVLAFAALLRIEARREAATVGGEFREMEPFPLGRARWPAFAAVVLLLAVSLLWPALRHLETAAGAHFGSKVATGGVLAAGADKDTSRTPPRSVLDGLRKGVRHQGVGECALTSLHLAAGGALVALLLALLLEEAGRGRRRLDRALLVLTFLPIALPPMALAVAWERTFPALIYRPWFPHLLLGVRLLPFAAFAARAARRRLQPELEEAAAMAGLPPAARFFRVTLPLMLPGAALGLLLAFLFGLREVDAIVFTTAGGETLPVKLYNMIHIGLDVQVAALAFLWTAGIALFLLLVRLVVGGRFRLSP